MKQLYQQLKKRKAYLESLQNEIERKLNKFPQGKLRASNDRGIPRYYWITDPSDTHGKYIRKKQQDLACQLAQKEYLRKLYQEAQTELNDINVFLFRHKDDSLAKVYDNLNDYRKNIVIPMVLSDELYIKQWEDEHYETNPYYPDEKVYSTKKDELVRSKSEVLLADMYYDMVIPYRYEAPLQLKNGKIKYPDFTVLKIKTREIIYHEHFGLLDDEQYRQANLAKLEEYGRNGIYPGKNLIITHEAEGYHLNIREIKRMVEYLVL